MTDSGNSSILRYKFSFGVKAATTVQKDENEN